MPPAPLLQVLQCGQVLGRDADRFATIGLTPLPATHVRPPLVAECVMNIECRVLGIQTIGDHDLFQGEVVEVHISAAIAAERGSIDPDKPSAVVVTAAGFYGLGDRLAGR